MIFTRTLAKNPNTVIRVIVPTKVLKDQWEERIEEYQLEGDIKVIVMNTAAKKPFYCDLLTLDEAHKCCAEQMAQLFQQTHPKWILGLTATYERLDGREKLVLDKYCPVCDTITIEDALANGWLAPYKEYKVLIDVDLSTYRKVNAEFNQHFAFFGYSFETAMGKCAPYISNDIKKNLSNCWNPL